MISKQKKYDLKYKSGINLSFFNLYLGYINFDPNMSSQQ
jgi:hypothetical protein